MSRFFRRQGESDSSESSSEEEERLSDVSDEEEAPAPTAPKKPMSRFLKTSSTSESSSEETDSDTDDSNQSEKPKKKGGRFIRGAESDDSNSDDETPRLVKSAKDRRQDEMQATGNTIDNAIKIDDWNAVNNGGSLSWFDLVVLMCDSTEFNKLLALVQRQTNLSDPVPSFFLNMLKSLENNINEAQSREKTASKKMNAISARGLNSVKQRLRKCTKEYETEIKSYAEDPEKYQAAENKAAAAPAPKKKKVRMEEEEEGKEEEDDTFKTVGARGKTMTFSTEALYKNLLAIQEARGKKVGSAIASHPATQSRLRIRTAMNKWPSSTKFSRLQ